MKKKLFVIKGIIFVCFLVILLSVSNKVLMRKEGTQKYWGFYEEKEQFDILFFGSSRVLDGIQPMELWDDYQIRSYNMAQHSESLAMDYWQLKNALEYQTPRLVVIDISMFYGNSYANIEDEESRAALHKQIDHMPMSTTKLQIIKNSCPPKLWAEYIFPFILYHSRWNEVKMSDFKKTLECARGGEVRTNIMPFERVEWDNEATTEVFIPENVNLDKIIELCHEKNVPLLFICMPNYQNYGLMGSLNAFEKYFNDCGVSYLNISRDEKVLNYQTDFADDSHLNLAGSIKISDYIGEYFITNYGYSEVDQKTKEKWDGLLNEYKKQKDARVVNAALGNGEELLNYIYADNDYEIVLLEDDKGILLEEFEKYLMGYEIKKGVKYKIIVYRQGESEPLIDINE